MKLVMMCSLKRFEDELQNIKNSVGNEGKMTVRNTKRIKEMIRTVGKIDTFM